MKLPWPSLLAAAATVCSCHSHCPAPSPSPAAATIFHHRSHCPAPSPSSVVTAVYVEASLKPKEKDKQRFWTRNPIDAFALLTKPPRHHRQRLIPSLTSNLAPLLHHPTPSPSPAVAAVCSHHRRCLTSSPSSAVVAVCVRAGSELKEKDGRRFQTHDPIDAFTLSSPPPSRC